MAVVIDIPALTFTGGSGSSSPGSKTPLPFGPITSWSRSHSWRAHGTKIYLFLGFDSGVSHRLKRWRTSGLCEKVKASEHVIEVQFSVKERYPESARQKGWPPPETVLKRVRRTGRVTQVFKGNLEPGSAWNAHWLTGFTAGGQSVQAWDRLFRRRRFSQVFFLEKVSGNEERWRSAGYAEESAPCGGADSNHRSWCPGYAEYKAAVLACLTPPKPVLMPIPEKMLAAACAHPCAGAGSTVIPWRTPQGVPTILVSQGDVQRCSHPPTRYLDADGHEVHAVDNPPVGPAELEMIQVKISSVLRGLVASEALVCPPVVEGTAPPSE